MSKPPVRARVVVVVVDGRVALIRRVRDGATYYLFPGGGVEDGETPEEAAVREAREELGVEVELGALVHEEVFAGSRYLYFAARIVGGEFGTGEWPHDVESISDAGSGTYRPVWLPLAELADVQVGVDVRPRELVARLAAADPKQQSVTWARSSFR